MLAETPGKRLGGGSSKKTELHSAGATISRIRLTLGADKELFYRRLISLKAWREPARCGTHCDPAPGFPKFTELGTRSVPVLLKRVRIWAIRGCHSFCSCDVTATRSGGLFQPQPLVLSIQGHTATHSGGTPTSACSQTFFPASLCVFAHTRGTIDHLY